MGFLAALAERVAVRGQRLPQPDDPMLHVYTERSRIGDMRPFPLAPSGLGWIPRRPVLLRVKCVCTPRSDAVTVVPRCGPHERGD
jgi:hypothetical protein